MYNGLQSMDYEICTMDLQILEKNRMKCKMQAHEGLGCELNKNGMWKMKY
jgi:hypothetical protein